MRNFKKHILVQLSILLLAFNSCDFIDKKEIIPYYFITIDEGVGGYCLYYSENEKIHGIIIDAEIIAVGFNNKYIIAKQQPNIHFKHLSTPLYYILPIKKGMNWRTNNNMLGPLTLNEFKAKQKELKIMDIKFKDVDNF